jgi:glycosyltransferase involved in cell wall biosynthesis
MNRSVSIVIPVHNEGFFVYRSTRSLIEKLKNKKFAQFEIVLIENGSSDNSLEMCHKLKDKFPQIINVIEQPIASYGQAIKTGILAATKQHVVIFNVDLWDINFLIEAKSLMPPAEIVVGSKTLAASRDERPISRRLMTYFFNSFLKIVFNFQGTDTHGIKIIDRELAVRLVKKCRALNELLDTELILRICRENHRYFELPIRVKEVRPSRYNNFRRAKNTLADISTVFRTKIYDLSHLRR